MKSRRNALMQAPRLIRLRARHRTVRIPDLPLCEALASRIFTLTRLTSHFRHLSEVTEMSPRDRFVWKFE
ncbi:MAG: hypothetical protein RLZZ584_4452 [Pseudomonadota bacterium]|jgi:hypothetical protein